MTLSQEVIDGLSPKIRNLVILLNSCGFRTTDSGDGTNAADGMPCAMDIPMVYVASTRDNCVDDADRIAKILRLRLKEEASWHIEANYSPMDGHAGVLITGVTDDDMHAG